jgi:hypothetical protein
LGRFTTICFTSSIVMALVAGMAIVAPDCYAQEPAPPGSFDERIEPPATRTERDAPPSLPQAMLTIDLGPQEAELPNQLQSNRPDDRASSVFSTGRVLFIGGEMCASSGLLYDVLEPARFCHRPLYFEDHALERHGRCCGRCPNLASAAHFFGSAVCLPCSTYRQPCDSCLRVPHPMCN